jgi:glutamyl-tRNA reductase
MHLIVLGLSHNTAPIEVRERLFISGEASVDILGQLKIRGAVEAAVLSTCNRTEIYATCADADASGRAFMGILVERFGMASLADCTYLLGDEEAYRHLFLVASGLDSMVIGEPQILGQVKDAHRSARILGYAGPFLDQTFNRAFQVAKRVRTETRIGYNPVSISAMAVALARKIFGEFAGRQILVIGAGEMCGIALKHFRKEGLEQVFVTNRTFRNAQRLAEETQGIACPFEDIQGLLGKVDMVLSSTGAEIPIVGKTMVQGVMKKRKMRPLFFIDIAVPRDIEPAVNDLENVYLYDIDDLKELSQAHLSDRLEESRKAHKIVDEEVVKFHQRLKEVERNPLIGRIRENVEAIRTGEMKKTLQRLKSADPETIRQLDMLTRAIVNKIVHPHLMMIKKNGSPAVLDLIKSLLLSGEEDEKEMDRGDEGE